MKFVVKTRSDKGFDDKVFDIVNKCKVDSDDKKINGVIGMLYDDNSKLVTLNSVYKTFDAVSWEEKARYAEGIIGNKDFNNAVEKWYTKDISLPRFVMTTPSGTAALTTCLKNFIEEKQTIIIPNVTWDPYYIIFDQYNLKIKSYDLTNNGVFNIQAIKEIVDEIKDQQENIVLIINDPCHNPTGYSMTINEWKELIDYANSLPNNVVIINDLAYIEYSFFDNAKDYFKLFNSINNNVLICLAISFSKSMTAYGMRMGSLICIAKKQEDIDDIKFMLTKTARGIWSNPNNGAMKCFTEILNNPEKYINEKQSYINLVKERAEIFLKAVAKYNLPIYPYKEGFFATIRISDDLIEEFHNQLIDHHLYMIKVQNGVRVGLCSIPKNKIEQLVKESALIYNKLVK